MTLKVDVSCEVERSAALRLLIATALQRQPPPDCELTFILTEELFCPELEEELWLTLTDVLPLSLLVV